MHILCSHICKQALSFWNFNFVSGYVLVDSELEIKLKHCWLYVLSGYGGTGERL